MWWPRAQSENFLLIFFSFHFFYLREARKRERDRRKKNTLQRPKCKTSVYSNWIGNASLLHTRLLAHLIIIGKRRIFDCVYGFIYTLDIQYIRELYTNEKERMYVCCNGGGDGGGGGGNGEYGGELTTRIKIHAYKWYIYCFLYIIIIAFYDLLIRLIFEMKKQSKIRVFRLIFAFIRGVNDAHLNWLRYSVAKCTHLLPPPFYSEYSCSEYLNYECSTDNE